MMQDPLFLISGLMPPILQPLKTPSKMTNVPDDYIHTHPEFKPNLLALYMTPTDYKFQILLDRTTDHYVSYASRNLPQLQYWRAKMLKFFFLQYNFLKPTAADLGSNPSDTTPASAKRLHHRTYQTFFQLKTPQNLIFQNHKFTSPFTFLGPYYLEHNFTIGTIRNYDPLKQAFLFLPYKNPNRPLIILQEDLILSDDYLTPANMPTHVQELSPYFQKILSSPLTDNERSYYHTLVQKRYTNAALLYIIAKFSIFHFNKQFKYGPFLQNKLKILLIHHSLSSPHPITLLLLLQLMLSIFQQSSL